MLNSLACFASHARPQLEPPPLGAHINIASHFSPAASVSHHFSYGQGPQDPDVPTGYHATLNVHSQRSALSFTAFPPSRFVAHAAKSLKSWLSVHTTAQNIDPESPPLSLEVDINTSKCSISSKVAGSIHKAVALSVTPFPSISIGGQVDIAGKHKQTTLALESRVGSIWKKDKRKPINFDCLPRFISTVLGNRDNYSITNTVNINKNFSISSETSGNFSSKTPPSSSIGYRYTAPHAGIEVKGGLENGMLSTSAHGAVLPGVVLGVGLVGSLVEGVVRTGLSVDIGD
ncbi:hypothetical protein P9112_006740 [Eukaryota sp. TZLM1-RC]